MAPRRQQTHANQNSVFERQSEKTMIPGQRPIFDESYKKGYTELIVISGGIHAFFYNYVINKSNKKYQLEKAHLLSQNINIQNLQTVLVHNHQFKVKFPYLMKKKRNKTALHYS